MEVQGNQVAGKSTIEKFILRVQYQEDKVESEQFKTIYTVSV